MDGALPLYNTVELILRSGYRLRRFAGAPRADCVPEVIISRSEGIVCAAIPLCGTRTLKNYFLSNQSIDFKAELLRDTVPNVVRSRLNGQKPMLFTVVRDPWSRVVCCYEKKIRGAYAHRSYRGVPLIAAYEGLSHRMSFDEFVGWLCSREGQDDVANRHWMSQHKFLPLPDLESGSIRVLRLESLERDLNRLLAHLPNQVIGKANSSATKKLGRLYAATQDYYTQDTRNAIADRYARDIELFGYEVHAVLDASPVIHSATSSKDRSLCRVS